ncbi:MAG: FtsW/RodA/SpoVE family cell cycle protein [Rikenellaceae bacterium]
MSDSGSIIYRLKGDKVIWIIVFLLSLISIAAVYSSSSSLAFKEGKSTLDFLLKQMRFVLFGLTTLYICYKIPLGWYRMLSYLGLLGSVALLIATIVIGKNINGADRWINIFGLSFQPAEIAKIATVLYLAKVLEDFKFETFKEFSIWVLFPIGVVCLLILNGSASTAIILAGISFLILFIAGIKWSHLLKSTGIALVTLILVVALNQAFGLFPRIETAVNRVKNFVIEKEISKELNPEEKQKEMDKTFQADMAKVAIASVGILGKGPGNSTQRYVLPHPYSDFIYTIIVEEWGFLGGLLVLMLYLWFLFRCIVLARSCSKVFTSVLVTGLGLLITSQALLHILVNVGILPVTGHTLPLISLGGTSLVIMSAAFGIILSVSRTIEVDKVAENEKKENIDKNIEEVIL